MKLMRDVSHWKMSGALGTTVDDLDYANLRNTVAILLATKEIDLEWENGPQTIGVGVVFQSGTEKEREQFIEAFDKAVKTIKGN